MCFPYAKKQFYKLDWNKLYNSIRKETVSLLFLIPKVLFNREEKKNSKLHIYIWELPEKKNKK